MSSPALRALRFVLTLSCDFFPARQVGRCGEPMDAVLARWPEWMGENASHVRHVAAWPANVDVVDLILDACAQGTQFVVVSTSEHELWNNPRTTRPAWRRRCLWNNRLVEQPGARSRSRSCPARSTLWAKWAVVARLVVFQSTTVL